MYYSLLLICLILSYIVVGPVLTLRVNLLLVHKEKTSRHLGVVCSLFAALLYPSLATSATSDHDEFLKLPVAAADGMLCH